MTDFIYRIATAEEWRQAQAAGRYAGRELDLRDGYIHFSTAAQVAETLRLHYRGQTGLVLLAVDPARLGARLKWEPARNGALFPHLYGVLAAADVAAATPIETDADGGHRLPDLS